MAKKYLGLGLSEGATEGTVVFWKEGKHSLSETAERRVILLFESLSVDVLWKIKTYEQETTDKVVGVITQKGGWGTHGAKLLREKGIPSLVLESVKGLLDDNDIVGINGGNGTVLKGERK